MSAFLFHRLKREYIFGDYRRIFLCVGFLFSCGKQPLKTATESMALPLQATDLSVQIPLVRGLPPLRPRNQQNDY